MPKMTIDKYGNVSFFALTQIQAKYHCSCGEILNLTLDWPDDTTINGELDISNATCPRCGKPVKFPKASYKAENGKLIATPIVDNSSELN